MPRANGITRQEILTSIKLSGALTAEELARELGISQVAVRQHLSSLEAESIIAVNVERRGLGRPVHRYRLTLQGDEMFPRRYDLLATSLLEELHAWQGEEAIQHLLQRRRERLQNSLLNRMKDRPLTQRMNELANALSEQGYMAEVHPEEPGTYRLYKRNCAIYSVARVHPELCCGSETEFYEELLGEVEVNREQTILEGNAACVFCVRACVTKELKTPRRSRKDSAVEAVTA